ncbi:MAG: hypothetical protein Q9M92_13860 [Enterobacterales bacterium]|nr:hypothetical protein [Enterobacterales bacterium]
MIGTVQAENESLAAADRENLKVPVKLQDLAYGEILFDYYRGNKIKALTRILIAQKKNQFSHHSNSAELLSGVIYLDLGMLNKAQGIFKRLLTEQDLKHEVLAKIEFYLGKLHYKQRDYPQAEKRLTNIYASLPAKYRDESLIMLSNISLKRNKLEKARDWLNLISQDSEYLSYSRYNLGILWLRDQKEQQALPYLKKVFLTDKPSKIQRSLQDKAKIALGFYYLKAKQYELAKAQFLSVRLGSIYTNKALLGIGWTYAEMDLYENALTHWLELSKKDIRDIAVQESLIAIPYAYQKLKAMQPALSKYLSASDAYQAQIEFINQIEQEIQNNDLIENLVYKIAQNNQLEKGDKGIKDSGLLGGKFDYYIYELLAQNSFNEDFRSYQKLGRLELMLVHWEQQLPMFSEMLEANQVSFKQKIPKVDAYLASGSFEKYRLAYDGIQKDLEDLKNSEKLYLLATPKQKAFYDRIIRIENSLANIPSQMLDESQLDKPRRAWGVLQWQLETNRMQKNMGAYQN